MSSVEGYQLVQRIGSGVGGAVYLAETGTGQVAIRQFESPSERDSELWRLERQRFLEAGRQALGLTHPHIVSVLDVIDEGEEAFVAMEYVAAETLEAAMAARRFTPKENHALLRETGMALDFAHGRGVVHGDLKTSNIFLPNRKAKVADFAVSPRARLDPHQPIPPHLIHRYLSPEHLRSPQSVDARSDQYSLAVIAYEMFTGQLPYGGASDLSAAILRAEIPRPSSLNPQLPPVVDEPLMKALDRDPARRFASCMEFVSVLEAGWITQPDVRARRRRPQIFAGIAALLVAAIALAEYRSHRKIAVVTPHLEAVTVTPHPPAAATLPAQTPATPTAATHTPPAPAPATTTPPKPPPPAPAPIQEPPPAVVGKVFRIDVFSRTHAIQQGSSFASSDQVLGEMGHGDLRAVAGLDGQPPRGRLTMEWVVDDVVTDKRRLVEVGRLVAYGNEPTSGSYLITLYLDARPVQSFTFRITP